MISIVIPIYNASSTLERCLQAIFASNCSNFECIVVDDSSSDHSVEIANQFPARILELSGGPRGPANARNCGADLAAGEFLLFIDADVVIHSDTVTRVAEAFDQHPDVVAVFGSYDESPEGGKFLSQYKNLLHHFVHQNGDAQAVTFWSGCGAIRRDEFLKLGGFDAKTYSRPSIEDIELGYRLRLAGYKILLEKEIQVTHLKSWSLTSLIKTDFIYRAIPWAILIFEEGQLPDHLNLQITQRLSAVFLILMLAYLGLFAFRNNLILLSLLTGLFLLLINGWHWYQGYLFFGMSQRMEKLTYFLMSSIGILALLSEMTALLAPLAILLPTLITGPALSKAGQPIKRLLFGTMMIAIGIEFILLFANYPLRLLLPFLAFLLLILLLNYQLYLFFLRKRGLVFALAVLPLQLFYYLYSVLAFMVGGFIYFRKSILKPA